MFYDARPRSNIGGVLDIDRLRRRPGRTDVATRANTFASSSNAVGTIART